MAEVDETPQQPDVPEAPSLSQTLRQALTDALGLPAETFLIEFLLGETTPPVVRCHFYPSPEAMLAAVATFAEYQLLAKPAPLPDVTPPGAPAPAPEQET